VDRLPPLNPLRAFESAGRLKSMTRAADELHVTPAAISRQVKALEDYLGVPLFARSHRAVNLTPVGEQFLRDITKSLVVIRTATQNVIAGRGRKIFKIQAYTTIAMRWLIPRLSSFHDAHPEIDVKLTTSLEWVDFAATDLDAVIRLGDGNWTGLEADRLLPNELVPVCSPVLLTRKPRLKSPADLRHQPLLHSLARPDDWAKWLKAAGINNVNAHGGLKYESSVLAYQAAIEGHGVAIAQKVFVTDDLESGKLITPFSFCLDMGSYTYYLLSPRRNNRELDMFRAWLKSQVRIATSLG
jgi:LysR family glycine cleavage system transcriptional activator